jgi:hypothetical protein
MFGTIEIKEITIIDLPVQLGSYAVMRLCSLSGETKAEFALSPGVFMFYHKGTLRLSQRAPRTFDTALVVKKINNVIQ